MTNGGFTRREFLAGVGAVGAVAAVALLAKGDSYPRRSPVFAARAAHYDGRLVEVISAGLIATGMTGTAVRGKSVLLKPNLVEPHRDRAHINTHPAIVRAAAEAFRLAGAASVVIGEGAGHRRDSLLVLEESGVGDVIVEDRIRYVDLNTDEIGVLHNRGSFTDLATLTFPATVLETDLLVSVAKMKTHHWAGVTLSLKNMFGVMPGAVYGWPKNVLHFAGVQRSILDINSTRLPDYAIIDGVVGMQGDGPIMGEPAPAGVVVMGPDPVAVDASATRIMDIDPGSVPYLNVAGTGLGRLDERLIEQRGEALQPLVMPFDLVPGIPAQDRLQRWA